MPVSRIISKARLHSSSQPSSRLRNFARSMGSADMMTRHNNTSNNCTRHAHRTTTALSLSLSVHFPKWNFFPQQWNFCSLLPGLRLSPLALPDLCLSPPANVNKKPPPCPALTFFGKPKKSSFSFSFFSELLEFLE